VVLVSVRRLRAPDLAQVAAWKRELWGDDDGEDQDETIFVWASDGDTIGGFVSLSLRPWAEGCAGAPVPYVEAWYVAEDLRGRGVGRALMRAAETWAREAGFRELGSDARLDNAASLQAHRRLGFVPTERLQFFRKSLEPFVSAVAIRVEEYAGPRAGLRSLFELAEDSSDELDAYIDAGRVLVAIRADEIVGHLQIMETRERAEAEIKNMAVLRSHQGIGVGRALVEAAVALARDEARSTLIVATAAADTGNLRFYQRQGFRMRSIERDAFTEATGYEARLQVDGIELRDRVWLDLCVDEQAPFRRRRL